MQTMQTKTVDAATLRAWLEEGRPVRVLDVRTQADREEWYIPGSQHVDAYAALKAGDSEALANVAMPDDAPIVTVCGAGKMSLVAAQQLAARGNTVYSLAGGMEAWSLAWNTAEVPPLTDGTRVIQVRRTGKGCLSYLIGSGQSAAVIDAALAPEVYMDLATRNGWQIIAVLDTHIHADHLSRARQLAEQTGAPLYLPPQERVTFSFTPLPEGASIPIGSARLRALHTPGHTAESTTYLLNEQLLFTGDTLFLNAVGRPDLEANSQETKQRAHWLYDSLQRLLTLPPNTGMLPGHTSTPAAFDGRPLLTTIDEVRAAIPRLALTESAFVEEILARIPPAPPNHQQIVTLNEAGDISAVNPVSLEAGANRCAIA